MDAIRFEPTIATDFAIDRRQGGNAGDMFADMLGEQLKKRGESERIDPPARRRPPSERRQAADPQGTHGRPIRPVIKHPPTVRGEARPVAEDRPQLTARQQDGAAPAGMDSEEAATLAPVDEADEATGPEIRETGQTETAAEAPPETTTETTAGTTGETLAETTGETMGQAPAAGEIPLAAVTVPPADTDAAPLEVEAADMAADNAQPDSIVPGETAAPQAANGETTDTAAAAAPTAVGSAAGFAAALVASQAATAAGALGDDGGTTADAMPGDAADDPLAAMPAGAAAGMTAALAEAHVGETAPAETAEAAAMTVKMTPETPRPAEPAKSRHIPAAAQADIRPQAPTAMPTPQASIAAQPAQGAGMGDSAATPFDDGLVDAEGSGMPGWSLHLAQGAAAKRPDFVAQLRQHLQDLPAHEQVAVNIQRALREGTGRLSIQLSPAELGKIHVKLDIDEEKRVTAAVTVEKPSTLELLQRDMKALERALHDAGLKMEGGDLSFSLGRQDGKEFSQDAGNSGRPAYGAGQAEDQVEAETQAASAAQVDTAAGVVNLEV